MNMQQNDNKTGTHTFTANQLGNKDVSTVRRMLGVHELVVVSGWSNPRLMGKLMQSANGVVALALQKASEAQ